MANITTQPPSAFANGIDGSENLVVKSASVVGAATAAVLARFIADRKYLVRAIAINMGTAGTAGSNDAICNIAGVPVAGMTASLAGSAGNNGLTAIDGPTAETELLPGQVFDIELSAVAGAGSPADATIALYLVKVLEES